MKFAKLLPVITLVVNLSMLHQVVGQEIEVRGGPVDATAAEILEAREWAKEFWRWYETGEISDSAISLAKLDSHIAYDPIKHSVQVFAYLYQMDDVWEKAKTNAFLMESIKRHSTMGVIITLDEGDVYQRHAQLAALHVFLFEDDPLFDDSGGLATSFARFDEKGDPVDAIPEEENKGTGDEGTGGQGGGDEGTGDQEEDDDPPVDEFYQDLAQVVWESALEEIQATPDESWWWVDGFDCDDFGQALEGWLHNHFNDNYDIEVDATWITWQSRMNSASSTTVGSESKKGKSKKIGNTHVIIKVIHNGLAYYVDPQAGIVTGGTITEEEEQAAFLEIINRGYLDDGEEIISEVDATDYDDIEAIYGSTWDGPSNDERRNEFIEKIKEFYPERTLEDYFPPDN